MAVWLRRDVGQGGVQRDASSRPLFTVERAELTVKRPDLAIQRIALTRRSLARVRSCQLPDEAGPAKAQDSSLLVESHDGCPSMVAISLPKMWSAAAVRSKPPGASVGSLPPVSGIPFLPAAL